MGQPVVHFELWSKNPAKIGEFYSKVFGWSVNHMPEMNYRFVDTGGEGGINGGIMQPQEGPWPGNMALYMNVDELATFRRKIVEAGGKIVVEQMDIPGVGSLCLFEDTDGRVMGMWQKAAP